MVLTKKERNETYLCVSAFTISAVIVAAGTLFENRIFHKISLSSSAFLLSTIGLVFSKTTGKEARRYGQLDINSQWEKALIISEHSLEDIYKKLHPRAKDIIIESEYIEPKKELAPVEEKNPFYDWNNVADESSGIIIAGPTGYGKSTVAIAILGMLTHQSPAMVQVLDPHANRNRWHEFGLKAISGFADIEERLINLEEELDKRRKKADNGEQIIVIIDELGACYDNFKNSKNVSRIIKRFLSEGRKYGICAILLNQSDNCSAIGIDSKYRDNAFLIALGSLARKMFKKGSEELLLLEQFAYPCAVGGCVEPQPAIHPTHGHHKQFKKKGNAPQGLLPINQIEGDLEIKASKGPTVVTSEIPDIDLEKLILQETKISADILSQKEWELIAFAFANNGVSVEDVLDYFFIDNERKWSKKKIEETFSRFCELGLGELKGKIFFPNKNEEVN